MKTAHDPRHKKRIQATRELFTWEFNHNVELQSDLAKAVVTQLDTIDTIIVKAAPEWPITQINKIDLSILRLAVYELSSKQDPPPFKVVVDEAVEIAKDYGSDSSPGFINGVLGKVISDYHLDKNQSDKV